MSSQCYLIVVFLLIGDKYHSCILQCFQKAGFKNELTNIDDSESGSDDDELPLSRLVNIRNTLGEIGVTLEEVVAVDNNVVVTETRSDDDIVNSLLKGY